MKILDALVVVAGSRDQRCRSNLRCSIGSGPHQEVMSTSMTTNEAAKRCVLGKGFWR